LRRHWLPSPSTRKSFNSPVTVPVADQVDSNHQGPKPVLHFAEWRFGLYIGIPRWRSILTWFDRSGKVNGTSAPSALAGAPSLPMACPWSSNASTRA
jgi:hypothetical protein